MQPGPQVLVKFKTGEKVAFEVPGYDEFVLLVDEMCKFWGKWLFVGPNAVVNKKDIHSLYYLREGWSLDNDSKSSAST